MEEGNKVVDVGGSAAAENIVKVTQLQTSHEGQVLQLQCQVKNLQQYIKDLEAAHAAELAKYAVKSDVDSSQTPSKLTETVEKVRIKDPLNIPEVVEMILKNLGKEFLRDVRSVCKLWNETYVRINSKHPTSEDLFENSISKLHSLLSKSSAPEAIIQNISCNGTYADYRVSIYEENLQKLLKSFGHKVKKLEVKLEKRLFSPIKSILVDSGEWCQNLEELNITVVAKAGNFKDFILKEDQLSRLKRLTFQLECGDNGESRIPGTKHLFSALIKASPNLECLIMHLPYEKSVKTVTECLKSLKGYPEVTRNLKEFYIGGNWTPKFNPFNNLLEVEFSWKLKDLTLVCECNPVVPKREIAKLLKKLGSSLESLTIWGEPYSDINTDGFDWPILPRLKYLNHYAQDQVELKLIEVKSKMPILEELILAGNSENFLIDKRCLGRLFDIEEPLRTSHQLTLKELTIFGRIYSPKIPPAINRMFPNISKLGIYIYPHKSNMVRQQRWFQDAFEGFSQMHKMTNLTICLRNCFQSDEPVDHINMFFEKLQNMPNLRFLTLISDSKVPVGYSFEYPVSKLLSNCQGLKCLNLIGFTGTFLSVARFIEEKGPDTQLKLDGQTSFVN